MTGRRPLTAERIIAAAARVADASGLGAVSMRNVGRELGVEAMSLYHHLAGKEALMDALADWVHARIELPSPELDWRTGTELRAASLRRVLTAHPWALGLVDSRSTPGPSVLHYYDATIGHLRGAGLSPALTSALFSAVDAYVFGFVLTEQNLPFDAAGQTTDFAQEIEPALTDHPHLAGLVTDLVEGGYEFSNEFDGGLALILDSVERRHREGE